MTTTPPRDRSIRVSLPDQKITVLDKGVEAKVITTFSTGRQGHLTPLLADGRILKRERMHYSQTYKDAHGQPAAMPFALFFNNAGCAFHAGDPDVDSHGCIHLPPADAEWLFDWVGTNEVGVQILGPNPKAALK